MILRDVRVSIAGLTLCADSIEVFEDEGEPSPDLFFDPIGPTLPDLDAPGGPFWLGPEPDKTGDSIVEDYLANPPGPDDDASLVTVGEVS